MSIETIAIMSGVLVVGLGIAAKLFVARMMAAKKVPVEGE
jgi:hypothetical protein